MAKVRSTLPAGCQSLIAQHTCRTKCYGTSTAFDGYFWKNQIPRLIFSVSSFIPTLDLHPNRVVSQKNRYGGPASQKVSTTYFRDWHSFLCTSLNYVVVMVDPRGTGYKGRDFRMPVRDRLGALEANDTVAAGR